MKNNYRSVVLSVIVLVTMLLSTNFFSQTIQFTFDNAQNTNDGSDDYYEADIMVQTIDGMGDFILGSVQMYFNYNTAAFGELIHTNGNFETSQPDGYILGEAAFGGVFPAYQSFVNNDNTSSRVSMSCQPALAADFQIAQGLNTMVTSTPKALYHIKIKYEDFTQNPGVHFEDNEDQVNGGVNDCRDQNYTSCGGTTTSDCFNFPGTQIHNAVFISTNAVLAVDDFTTDIVNLSLYPNPSSGVFFINGKTNDLTAIEIYDINGKRVLTQTNSFERIDISELKSAVYLVKLYTKQAIKTIKLVKK